MAGVATARVFQAKAVVALWDGMPRPSELSRPPGVG